MASKQKNAAVEIIQATTSYHYHVLPSDLARATLSPERAAISQYLSRLGSNRFVDFIVDVLVEVEGHTLVDRTDGPGDEKQDILTLDPEGQRHLTQCKHTVNYEENTSGDELDLLLGACLRKDCRSALYVTNTDLTAQAKRYVTDREYTRGAEAAKDLVPHIDYWNGRRIWDRVSKSNAILNKWFSGMAQAHALRRFFTDVVITDMPEGESCPLDAAALAAELGKSRKVVPVTESHSFDVEVDGGLTLNLSDWFRGSGRLGAPFLLPDDRLGHPNVPLRTVRVQALLSKETGAFDVAACRDRIATLIAATLPGPGAGAWWHVLVTGPEAFVFLQDVSKAVLVTVEEATAFVRVGEAIEREANWAIRPSRDFSRVRNPDDPDDEEDEWLHEASGTVLRVLVPQPADPLVAYEMHLRQESLIEELRTHTFRAVENADAALIETVRRLSRPEWRILHSTSGELFWTYPPDADARAVERLERTLARKRVQIFAVADKDRKRILAGIDPAPTKVGMIVTSEHSLTTPVALTKRIVWLSREGPIGQVGNGKGLIEVLKYKAAYEAAHGHDILEGRGEATFAGEELRRLLFDPMSLRGRRMLDVGFHDNRVAVHLRIRDGSTHSASDLAREHLEEFERVWAAVRKFVADPVLAP